LEGGLYTARMAPKEGGAGGEIRLSPTLAKMYVSLLPDAIFVVHVLCAIDGVASMSAADLSGRHSRRGEDVMETELYCKQNYWVGGVAESRSVHSLSGGPESTSPARNGG
jgi:hypothetical protein